jgi:hypothetical protein
MKWIYIVGMSDSDGFTDLLAFEDYGLAEKVAYGLNQYREFYYYDVEEVEVQVI